MMVIADTSSAEHDFLCDRPWCEYILRPWPGTVPGTETASAAGAPTAYPVLIGPRGICELIWH